MKIELDLHLPEGFDSHDHLWELEQVAQEWLGNNFAEE